MEKSVIIYTDGACEGNPGPGGWAAVLLYGRHRREISGGEPATTNNRMELQAAIESLAVLKKPCRIELHTDSQYVRHGITQWIQGWKRKGWRGRDKQPIKNVDLWQRLDACTLAHQIDWRWLRGHAGHEHNERCDELACVQAAAMRETHSPERLRAMLAVFKAGQRGGDATKELPL